MPPVAKRAAVRARTRTTPRRTPAQAAPPSVGTAPHEPQLLSIGELAERTHVSTRTIRYYEELGILPGPPRSTGGTRRYPKEYVFYIEGALALKQLGFRLDEVAELGRWALGGRPPKASTRRILRDKVAELEHRIRLLNRLHELITEAASGGAPSQRPGAALLEWLGHTNGDGQPRGRRRAGSTSVPVTRRATGRGSPS